MSLSVSRVCCLLATIACAESTRGEVRGIPAEMTTYAFAVTVPDSAKRAVVDSVCPPFLVALRVAASARETARKEAESALAVEAARECIRADPLAPRHELEYCVVSLLGDWLESHPSIRAVVADYRRDTAAARWSRDSAALSLLRARDPSASRLAANGRFEVARADSGWSSLILLLSPSDARAALLPTASESSDPIVVSFDTSSFGVLSTLCREAKPDTTRRAAR